MLPYPDSTVAPEILIYLVYNTQYLIRSVSKSIKSVSNVLKIWSWFRLTVTECDNSDVSASELTKSTYKHILSNKACTPKLKR